jgi:nicotinamidase-related amidase
MDLADDLVSPDGCSAGSGYPEQAAARLVVARTADAVAAARTAGELVVWVRLEFASGYADHPAASPLFGAARAAGAFRAGGPGAAVLADLAPAPDEPVVVKPRVSPFYGTRLNGLLRTAGIEEVVLCGVATDHVVLAGARDAHDRDYAVTVLLDATASSTNELHDAALKVMRSFTRQVTVDEHVAATVGL